MDSDRASDGARVWLRWVVAAALATALVALSACGSSDSSDSGEESAGGGGDTAAVVAKAEEEVEKWSDVDNVDFPLPPGTIDPGRHKAAIFPAGYAAGCKEIADDAGEAFDFMGWSHAMFDGEYDPGVQAQQLAQMNRQDWDAIVMCAINPENVRAQITETLDKGITVVCVQCAVAGRQPFPEIIQVGDNGRMGEALQWMIIRETEGQGNIVQMNDKSFPVVQVRVESLQEGIEENCPDCTIRTIEFPTADIPTPGPPVWSAELQQDPEVDWGQAPYDAVSSNMAKTAQSQSLDIGIGGYDGTKEMVQLIANYPESGVITSVGGPYTFMSWVAADLAARQVVGEPLYEADAIPFRLVTPDNWERFKTGSYSPKGFDLEGTFAEAWGK